MKKDNGIHLEKLLYHVRKHESDETTYDELNFCLLKELGIKIRAWDFMGITNIPFIENFLYPRQRRYGISEMEIFEILSKKEVISKDEKKGIEQIRSLLNRGILWYNDMEGFYFKRKELLTDTRPSVYVCERGFRDL